MTKKPEIVIPGAKFVMKGDGKGNPRALFYIHSWSHDGYRWKNDAPKWEPVPYETSSHILEKLFFGEFHYESLTKDLAAQLFPGSTESLPKLIDE